MPEPGWIFSLSMVTFASALWSAAVSMGRTRRDQMKMVIPLAPRNRPAPGTGGLSM